MLLSKLAEKELIQVSDGVRYGYVADTDLLFDAKSGKIIGFELKGRPGKRWFYPKMEQQEYIPWEAIVLIGEHRILFQKTALLEEEILDE